MVFFNLTRPLVMLPNIGQRRSAVGKAINERDINLIINKISHYSRLINSVF